LKTSLIIPLVVAASFCHGQAPLSATGALKLAAQNRPALRSAKLSIEQARISSKALGAYAPTTFLIGASSRSELGSNDMDLQLSQPLDFFGRRSASKQVGEAGIQLSLAEYMSLATELQHDVLTAYAESVANQHQKEVAAELLKISEGLLVATKRRFDEGKVAETQVTRASIEFERAKQSAELTSADLSASLEKLSGLLGTEASKLIIESDAKIEPLLNPVVDGRADLLVLKSQVQIAEAEAGVSRVSNRPELNAQIVRSPWSNDPGYFAGRLQLSWALFDHGRAKNETNAAKKKAEAAQKLLEDATARAKAEVKAAQIALGARQSRIARYEAILASARDLVAKSQKGYSEGFGTQIDVLEATRALREVEQELVEARQQLSLAVIAQYRASGFLAEVLK
jgi:cobalt-zinc-cadmium efflux system outer membrane protein